MRQSQLLAPTVKESPADAQVKSHVLMVRAGMIRKIASGIYTYLPLGWRVFQKVAQIVREEMNRAGGQEILMPAVQPKELWEDSGRWEQYGPELLRFHDRKQAEFCLGPTHEEVVTSLVRDEVRSYKQLPLNLYQVQTKFRDEIRPRFGVMRGREFIMKDAYSFDIDEASANKSYDVMFAAYRRIFARCGLDFSPVEADTGAIGGNRSHEFQVLADTGEDAIVRCEGCGYAANVELAEIHAGDDVASVNSDAPAYEEVQTPGQRTIEEVAGFLGVESRQVLKALLFMVDDVPVMAVCRGDHDVNEVKLRRALGASTSRMMDDAEVVAATKAPVGYAGPVGVDGGDLRIIADHAVAGLSGMVAGANAKDAHFVQVAVGRDFDCAFYDLRTATGGDRCGRCGEKLIEARGIEVGHVFYLGTKYSEAMGAKVLDESGKDRLLEMGCYGIGVTRTAAAAIEQNHDDNGILWPAPIAPFHVSLVWIDKDEASKAVAETLYQALLDDGIEVLFDDRKERPGVKFKDADLIGCPLRVAVGGRGLKDGIVEVKLRRESKDDLRKVPVDQAHATVRDLVRGLLDDAAKKAKEMSA